MKKAYIKPTMLFEKDARGFVPIVAAVASAVGVSQAVAGLALGAAAGVGTVAAGTAVAKKIGSEYSLPEGLPFLEAVESY